MPKISPFLWFDTQAEEAANFYVSIFPNSKITRVVRHTEHTPGPAGSVLVVDQAEVDHYWDKLSEGGQTSVCGWTKDRFGLSWQVTPDALLEMITDPDPAKVDRVMAAMMQMTKLDIARLREAYAAA